MSVKIEGMDILLRQLDELGFNLQNELGQAALKAARALEFEAKTTIEESTPSGRVYKKGNATHQASAEGQPPAIDIGTLHNSILAGPLAGGIDYGEAEVRVDAEYGLHLEMGTIHMEARPYMRPAMDSGRENMERAAQHQITRAIRAIR